jgi:hypothetical protein
MKEKPKNPSLEKEKSTTAGKAGTEVELRENSGDDNADTMSDQEMAAFQKIMDEIEDQEEDKLNGPARKDDETAPEAPQDQQAEPEATDDFAAELEKVAGAADPAENDPSTDNDDDAHLDEDQQKAFESIMAQIEGGGADEGESASEAPQDQQAEPEATDDFAAELEKVAGAADPAENDPSTDDDDDAHLDEDQQKAFESIMAQIEGGGADEGESASEAPQDQQAEPEATDDFAAELEKVAGAADPAENDPSADNDGETRLDEGLQKSVESAGAADVVNENDASPPDPDESNPTGSEAVNAPDGQGATDAGHAIDDADESSEDISDDIDDILKAITTSDEESDLQETVDEDIVVHQKKSPGQEKGIAPEAVSLPDKKEDTVGLDAEPATDAPSEDRAAKTSPALRMNAQPETEPLREAPVSTGGGKKKIVAAAVFILAIAVTGYFYWPLKRLVESTSPIPDPVTRPLAEEVGTAPTDTPQVPAVPDAEPSDESRLKTTADNLDRLRNELIDKQAQIQELRDYYQAGIEAEIQGVIDTVGQINKSKFTFDQALAEPRINLGLAAIQRRETYIRRLEDPVNELFLDSEELLYLSRKAGLLAMMAVRTSDIDVDGFIQLADEVSHSHRKALAQLDIDDVPATPLDLKTIWKEIARRLPARPVNPIKKDAAAQTDNAALWKKICEGDYSEKNKLTALSPQAARCMARWKGKDLFLNALTDLSAEAARGLADWEGEWLGLNGLKELTPEAAVHLARWKGKGLSLNGLSRLSPRVVAILSEWQGDQIELVHVKHMAHWENPNTRLFLSEDLKRKRNATRK